MYSYYVGASRYDVSSNLDHPTITSIISVSPDKRHVRAPWAADEDRKVERWMTLRPPRVAGWERLAETIRETAARDNSSFLTWWRNHVD